MQCPFCLFDESLVVDSRSVDGRIRRRRECKRCHARFTTYEDLDRPLLMVQKRDGTYEPFDRDKLIKGIYNAIKKRPISTERIRFMVERLEDKFHNTQKGKVTSVQIGNAVMEELKSIDPVAYVRFASVYQDFSDVKGFIAAISALENPKKK